MTRLLMLDYNHFFLERHVVASVQEFLKQIKVLNHTQRPKEALMIWHRDVNYDDPLPPRLSHLMK